MKLHFEPNLDYQLQAIEAVCDLFRGQEVCRTEFTVTMKAPVADDAASGATPQQMTLGVAESLTGGLIGARIVNVPGASEVFRGTIGAYSTDVKRSVLGVTAESVVTEEAASQMAEAAQRVLGADVGIAVTGVAGPTEQDGVAVGTVFFGIAIPGRPTETVSFRLPGDRERIRQFSTISLLSFLRQRLDAAGS